MVDCLKNKRSYFLFGILILLVFVNLSFLSAFTIQSVTPNYINRTVPTIINFTINNTDGVNITNLVFSLPMKSIYYMGNGTSASGSNFSNVTSGFPPKMQLNWSSTSVLIPINQTRSFWFNATLRNIGEVFTNITLEASSNSGSLILNSYNYLVNFGFSGFVRNETGGNESNVNITIYRILESSEGPPVETLEANVLSDANGSFSFWDINGSASLYKLKMVRYGLGNCVSGNSSCNATKIGPSLPPFPAMMYYPTTADLAGIAEFMRPPSLNGTTFYLNPAATLRLYANNGSTSQKFGYEVIDQKVGFSTESNAMGSVSTKDVIIPIGRNFTVMFSRFPGFPGNSFGFSFDPSCNGAFMNDTLCPTPPISISNLSLDTSLIAGQILIVNQSLVTSNYRLTGCINTGGNNNSAVNITKLSLKMVPWPGFVPPTRGDMGDINLSNDISYNLTLHSECNSSYYNNSLAYYNISVMGAVSGINYLLEIYAKNASDESGNPGSANNLATFQNISISGNTNYNLTFYKLVGGYYNGTSVNTSQIKINIQNSTGGAITNNLNANIKVKNPVFGTMNYMIESMNSGSFYMPILNNSNWAKILIFSNDAPPKEITLNLSKSEININLVTMTDGKGIGMKRINESGDIEMINTSENTIPININFLRHTSGAWGSDCNVLVPDSSCSLTSMDSQNFNPLSAMVAGKVNMEMKITSTNVTMTFVNFDMFSAKQPPLDSVINEHASGNTTADQTWQFGSFAPSDAYDYVIIGMPYSDLVINDSNDINLSTPSFYDENWNVVWNKSRGDSDVNLTDDFIDYNNSESGLYKGYLNSGGIICNKTDSNLNVTPCYVNTTSNIIYMKVPHFSGVGPNVIGIAPISSSPTTTTTSSSGGGASTIVLNISSIKTKKKVNSWTKIVPGNVSIMKDFSSDMGIKEIQIEVKNIAKNVKITVTKYSAKPTAVSKDKSGKVYKYLHIETKNLVNNLSKAIIKVQVEKSWLNNNSLKRDDVALFKFKENLNDWVELNTVYVEEDNNYDYYNVELNNFSYFVISEKILPKTEIPALTGKVVSNTTIPSDKNSGNNIIVKDKINWILLIVVLFILVLIGVGIFIAYKKYHSFNNNNIKVVDEKMGKNKMFLVKSKK